MVHDLHLLPRPRLAEADGEALARERARLDSRVRLQCRRIAPAPWRTRLIGGLYAGLCGGALFALLRGVNGGHAPLGTSVVIGILLGAFCVSVWPDRPRDCARSELDRAGVGFPAYRVTVCPQDSSVVVALVGRQFRSYKGVLLDAPNGWTVVSERFRARDDAETTERVAELRVQAERLVTAGRSRFDALYRLSESGRDDTWTFPAAFIPRSPVRRSPPLAPSHPFGGSNWVSAIAQERAGLHARAVIHRQGPTGLGQRARACHKANLGGGAATIVCVICGSLGAPFRGPGDAALLGVAFLAALIVGFVLIFVAVEVADDESETIIELVGRQERVSGRATQPHDRWTVVTRRFPSNGGTESIECAAQLRAQADQLNENARDAFLEAFSDFEAGAVEREDARLITRALA